MAGSAVMTTSRSSADMKNAVDVSASAQPRDDLVLTMGRVLLEQLRQPSCR